VERFLRFEVLTAMKMSMAVIWVVILCGLADGYQCFTLKMEVNHIHTASQPRRPSSTWKASVEDTDHFSGCLYPV
jgi:hypothetical protein